MVTWYRLLDSAKTSLEVVAIARDYLATWTPEEIGRLPVALRPGKLRDEGDIEDFHARLVEEYRGSKASGAALDALQRLTTFMVRAAIRIAELTDARPKAEPGDGPSEPKSAAPRSTH